MYIENCNELLNISSNGVYELTQDIDFEYKAIDKIFGDFKGILDGKGHKIKNIVLKASEIWMNNQPICLFYTLRNATVKNVTFENIFIDNEESIYNPQYSVLCDDACGTLFENIEVNLNLKNDNIFPIVYNSYMCEYKNVKLSKNLILYKNNL